MRIPAEILKLTGNQKFFLARKVVGYLFFRPVCCASILVSILRTCGDQGEAAQKIGQLLFDPMLVNYGGALSDYLRSLSQDDPALSHVGEAMEREASFGADLQTPGPINECTHRSARD